MEERRELLIYVLERIEEFSYYLHPPLVEKLTFPSPSAEEVNQKRT
jgi:hypothetical protein